MEKSIHKNTNKILLISYDDGPIQDKRFIDFLNKYDLKGTFNINSGQLEDENHIHSHELQDVYKGHEVAVHTVNHPHLPALERQEMISEITDDQHALESIVGYDIHGMAYPFGTYDDEVLDVLKSTTIQYSRTVKDTHNFNVPQDPLEFHPTCYHKDPILEKLVQDFIGFHSDTLSILTIWGHTWEYETEEEWIRIESILKMLSECKDISSLTMIDFVEQYL